MGIWKVAGKMPYLASAFCFYMLAEGMWEPGSWEWAALGTAFLIIGLVLNNWAGWSDLIPKIRFVAGDNESQESADDTWLSSFKEFRQSWLWAVTVLLGFVVLLSHCQVKLNKSIFGRQWDHPYLSADEAQKTEESA